MNNATQPQRRFDLDIADLATLVTAIVWAGNNLVVKTAIDEIDPFAYVFARFAIVVVVFFPWLLSRRVPLGIRRRHWGRLIFCGVTGFAIYNLLFTIGLGHTSAFSAALLVNTGPVFALILSAVLKLETVRPIQWAGAAVAIAGIVVFQADKLSGSGLVIGDLFAITAAMIWAIYLIATRPLSIEYGAPVVTAWSVLVGLVAITPVSLPIAVQQDWVGAGWEGAAALFYSSILSMLIGYTFWTWAVLRRGVGRTAPYQYAIPVFTGFLSYALLGESMGPLKIIGAALVLAGIVLARQTGATAPRRTAQEGE